MSKESEEVDVSPRFGVNKLNGFKLPNNPFIIDIELIGVIEEVDDPKLDVNELFDNEAIILAIPFKSINPLLAFWAQLNELISEFNVGICGNGRASGKSEQFLIVESIEQRVKFISLNKLEVGVVGGWEVGNVIAAFAAVATAGEVDTGSVMLQAVATVVLGELELIKFELSEFCKLINNCNSVGLIEAVDCSREVLLGNDSFSDALKSADEFEPSCRNNSLA
jgi:hypothetical protein